MTCISTPISWLRLETFAMGERDASVAEHLAACPACARCLDEIERDVVALPVLAVPERVARRRWWQLAVPALAAAVAVLVLVIWRGDERREDVVGVKGLGEVAIDVVRERDGAVRDDVTTFAPGDRWKVVITCAASATARVDVTVADGTTIDRPLASADITCGNRVVLPGAFHVTGTATNRVCARVASASDTGTACITLRPER